MPTQNSINNQVTDNDFTVTNLDAGANAFISVSNLSAAASSNAVLEAVVANATAGDAFVALEVIGGQEWVAGIDNSDSDAYVISAAALPGTSNVFKSTTGGAVSIPLGNFSVARSASGADVSGTVSNTSNTASSTASQYITVAGATASDAVVQYAVSGVTTWTEGIDNSDSDAYVLAASSALGTSNAFKITTAGAPTFPLAPLNVASGGTGDASLTAYAVLCGGTTSTNPVQSIASVGTLGQILTSNGASLLPTFQSISATGAFDQVVIQVFTGSGTYTPTSGMKYCIIEILGGGGAGGGGVNTGASANISGGSGGAAGEYARGVFSAATIGASKTVTIGAAGTGVSGAAGNAGGNSSVGVLITANGGAGGNSSAAAANPGPVQGPSGGVAGSGGSFRTAGANGSIGYFLTVGLFAGNGANTLYGAGGLGSITNVNGGGAIGYGAGGGGASTFASAATTGGVGAPGIVIVTEFVSV